MNYFASLIDQEILKDEKEEDALSVYLGALVVV